MIVARLPSPLAASGRTTELFASSCLLGLLRRPNLQLDSLSIHPTEHRRALTARGV